MAQGAGRRLVGGLGFLLSALSCGGSDPDHAWPTCAATTTIGPLAVDAALVRISNRFSVSIHGTVDDSTIRSLDFQNGSGTVAISSGTVQGALYDQYDIGGYHGYIAVVPIADRWHVLYPYCSDGRLWFVWHFDTGSQHFRRLDAAGSCVASDVASSTDDIALAGSSLNLAALCGVEVEATGLDVAAGGVPNGETISLGINNVGTAVRRDSGGALVRQDLIPFAGVNCSSCGRPGWYEVHSILWNAATRVATYGVLYLFGGTGRSFPDQGNRLLLDALFTSPQEAPLSVGIFEGSWKAAP